jgi:hypothetical protein
MSPAISARKRRKGPLAESRPHIPSSSEWDTILAKAENFNDFAEWLYLAGYPRPGKSIILGWALNRSARLLNFLS